MTTPPKDRHYRKKQPELVDFVFDKAVTQVFPDMIRRSVPGYDALITLLGLFAEKYVQDHSSIYDLGCSTGATSLAFAQRTYASDCALIAVDNSAAMIAQCKKNLADIGNLRVTVQCADILEMPIENASLIALNFTLQFIPPSERPTLLNKIYTGLRPDGVLILSEKLAWEGEPQQAFHDDFHQRFKSANGYSDLEIAQKRSALEHVLIPDTLGGHIERLRKVGFKQVTPWFQCFNFVSIAAMK
ncbi:MAG: carboxy-S-adenosyl-L-methionine synthase CmoA [Thiohalomonadales bacterium]